jgi:hypothetical protein
LVERPGDDRQAAGPGGDRIHADPPNAVHLSVDSARTSLSSWSALFRGGQNRFVLKLNYWLGV